MTNQEIYGYKPFPIYDGHFHITFAHPIDETVKMFDGMMKFFGCERIAILSTQQNSSHLKALYTKAVMNEAAGYDRVYAFGGIYHYRDERDTSDGYLEQVKKIHALGFDGIKMMDGKPGPRKALGRQMDDPIFDKMFEYAEANDMPVTYHVGDPPEYWDINKISEYALKVGWFCDESYPSLEQLRIETEGILKKFPKLRVTLAHFYFLSHDPEACVKLFETYPNVSFDLTPGGEMFANFSKRPDVWKAFFKKYADRLHFGTDTHNYGYCENIEDYGKGAEFRRNNLIRRCLETSESFEHPQYGTVNPIALDDDTIMTIYRDNFIKRLGRVRDIDFKLAGECAKEACEFFESGAVWNKDDPKNACEKENLEVICSYFNK